MIFAGARSLHHGMPPPEYLVILLLKLAVAASLASILTRFSAFRRMLMREERTLAQRGIMALVCSLIFGAGVGLRVITSRLLRPDAYQALDLGFEASFVMGILGGYVTGLLAGVLISLPAMLNGELMTMPLFAGVGVMGALLRDLAPDKEAVWKLTAFPDANLWALLRKRDLRLPIFSVACIGAILFAELVRSTIAEQFPNNGIFALQQQWTDSTPWLIAAQYAATLFATILPIKIWHSSRNESMLESQRMRLNEARLAALSSQINPHFLFNTLNSVASLIRTNPEQARQVVYKLSKILRRLLRQQDNLVPLSEELTFIDDYLSIEMVRFGDKLRFVKEVEPDCLDRLVPSMMLQPIIENSIRHGLASKVEGGTIRVRAVRQGEAMLVQISDDGVGIPEERLETLFELGIGVSNVNERLKVLYGDSYKMWVDSQPAEGTRTGIEIPGQVSGKVDRVETMAGSR